MNPRTPVPDVQVSGNVLCVSNFASSTGYAWHLMERLWVRIAQLAQAQGGEVFVAFPELNGVSELLRGAPLQVTELKVPSTLPVHTAPLRRFIRENRIRTIYFTDRPYWSPLYALLRSWGVRSIIIHDHVPGDRLRPPEWKLTAKRLRHRVPGCSADLYIGVSAFVHERFSRIAGVPAERCVFVRNGVEAPPQSGLDVRRCFGLPADAAVIVSCGRATFYKGIDFIIRCAARLILGDEGRDVYFVHVGDGPDMPSFARMVQELGLTGRFILAGTRGDVRALLGSCTIALHASRGEAFSLAILEFMAAGLPTLVPAHCGNGEAIEHGVQGVLYTPGDLHEAVSWLRRLLDEPAERNRIGAAARDRAREEFSLERMEAGFTAAVLPFIRTGTQGGDGA